MGKKRIIEKSQEELIKEREKVDSVIRKGTNASAVPGQKEGRIYVFSSYNNTIITLTDHKGDVIKWASAGSIGFKGTKKATPFAASKVAEAIVIAAKKFGIEKVKVLVKGIGSGRESALRSVATHGLTITTITDITPIPHNGCRAKKTRRV